MSVNEQEGSHTAGALELSVIERGALGQTGITSLPLKLFARLLCLSVVDGGRSTGSIGRSRVPVIPIVVGAFIAAPGIVDTVCKFPVVSHGRCCWNDFEYVQEDGCEWVKQPNLTKSILQPGPRTGTMPIGAIASARPSVHTLTSEAVCDVASRPVCLNSVESNAVLLV